jgi:acetyl esterase/lipase
VSHLCIAGGRAGVHREEETGFEIGRRMISSSRSVPAFLLLFLAYALRGSAQGPDSTQRAPRDTSFTVQSAAMKVLQSYPHAKAVVPVLARTVVMHGNVVYASIGNRQLRMDLFEPAKSDGKSFPAILFIHGGGWSSGDRSMEFPLAQRLATRGFVTAAVEYRLSPEARYPAAVHDLKAAVRWLRAHAAAYYIDTAKIGVCGGSAGGHLATLLGATNGIRQFEEAGENLRHSSNVQAVVDIDGPVDFTHPAESGKDDDPQKPSAGRRWIGFTFKERPDLWREASPLTYRNEKFPPIAFINSSIERFHVGRDELIDRLKSLNVYYEVHQIPDTPHPFWLFHPWFEQTATYVELFFSRTLETTRPRINR